MTQMNQKLHDLATQEVLQSSAQYQSQTSSQIDSSSAGIPDERTAQRKMRLLENKLDKLMLKINEAYSMKSAYKAIHKQLKEENSKH